jgi:uncharacterized integral membrane protein
MTAHGQPYQQDQPYQPNQPGAVDETSTTGRKRAVSAGQILGGLLFVLTIVFIIENSRSVKIRLIFPEIKAPLYVAILIAAVLGALIASLLRYRRHRNHPTR